MPLSQIHVAELNRTAANPLLMLHGVGRIGRDFAPLLPWLADRHLFLWDHRGHGRSDRAAGEYLVRDYAADVVAWLQSSRFESVDLYGHSLGALVALRAAAEVPERVRSLILEDPPSPSFLSGVVTSPYYYSFVAMQQLAGSSRPAETIAAALAEVRLGPTDAAPRLGDLRDAASLRFMARCLQEVDPAVFIPLIAGRWLDGYDFDATLTAVACPVLLLHGEVENGGMLPADDARHIIDQLRNVTLVRFVGAGHLLHWQRLEETVRAVIGFLESLPPSSLG